MSEFFGSVWWMLVTLGLLITFHEFGHFWVARRLGVKVLRFSVGFGKALWSRVGRDGTEYRVAAIPLGGYVKFLDERELETSVEPSELTGAFNRAPVLSRIAITAAGPIANFLFAIFAFWLMFTLGRPDYQPVVGRAEKLAAEAGFAAGDRIVEIGGERKDNWTDVGDALLDGVLNRQPLSVKVIDSGGVERVRTLPLDRLSKEADVAAAYQGIGLTPHHQVVLPAVVGSVSPGSAAKLAGVQPGDRITAIGPDTVREWADVPRIVQAAEGHVLNLHLERNGSRVDIEAEPRRDKTDDGKTVWRLGIAPQEPPYDATQRFGPLAAIPKAIVATWDGAGKTLDRVGRMVVGAISTKNLSGVIGIAQAANGYASLGLAWFLNFLALISISLGVLNLMPIPVLDGGHLLYYLVELIRGKPVSERVQIAAQYAGLFLIVALMSLALYNDVFHLTGRG